MSSSSGPLDVICFSLEPWDEVWRRNQWFVAEILKADPTVRLLFAEIPVDPFWSLAHRRIPGRPQTRRVGDTGRLWVTTPWKPLPRKVWLGVDNFLGGRILASARRLRMSSPVLWINDTTYAGLVERTGWPSVYDITDDWLDVAVPEAQASRERRNNGMLMRSADEVVVCSPELEARRGKTRPVHLIPNGVDAEHLRRPQTRPTDLPDSRIVLYQGTLKEDRLDVDLCLDICHALGTTVRLVFVGPISLQADTDQRLRKAGAVLLGPRAYERLPGYLQHADVLVVPHRVTPFTESLDPIKAREFQALGRPTLSTPVAGFRHLGPPVSVAPRESYVHTLLGLLAAPALPAGPGGPAGQLTSWSSRAADFLQVLRSAQARHGPGETL
jgi:glycosyltransferase involved in cell wall biosynthesis